MAAVNSVTHDGPEGDPISSVSNIARQREAARRDGGSAYRARRAEIARAAAVQFKERGYRGTTLAHIAEALGTDRASLYYYVSGKEELFQEIVTDATLVTVTRAHAIREGPGTGAQRLRALVRSTFEAYAEFYPVLYVLTQENLGQLAPSRREWAERQRRVIRDWEQTLLDIVSDGQRDGSIRDDGPAWLHAYAVSGAMSWSYRWYRPDDSPLSAAEIGETMAGLLVDGLSPQAGDRPAPPA